MPDQKADDLLAARPFGDVALETKTEPSQDRAKTTFENILTMTGELLIDVGFERLTTNLVCKRAGITPPALYRYFPNKYAILHALGERLMAAQDEIVFEWMTSGGLDAASFEETVSKIRDLMDQVIRVTKTVPGGVWVVRVMRVVPILREVRLKSRDLVVGELFNAMRTSFPHIDERRLRIATTVATETLTAATEFAIDEPEREAEIAAEACYLVASYFDRLRHSS